MRAGRPDALRGSRTCVGYSRVLAQPRAVAGPLAASLTKAAVISSCLYFCPRLHSVDP